MTNLMNDNERLRKKISLLKKDLEETSAKIGQAHNEKDIATLVIEKVENALKEPLE